MKMHDPGVLKVLACVEISDLARELGISYQAVYQWRRVPPDRVLTVSRITGLPPHELRPDLYPEPEKASAA